MNIHRRRATLFAAAFTTASVLRMTPQVWSAPPDRLVRVGLISSFPPGYWSLVDESVTAGLRDAGYLEGRNLELIRRPTRFPDGPMERNVDELLALKPDAVIAACGWSVSMAVRQTKTTPIVMVAVSDPVSRGWVPALSRPTATVTGVTAMMRGIPEKIVDHLRLMLPDLKAVGIGYNRQVSSYDAILRDVESAARGFGISIVPIDLNPLRTVDLTREALAAARVGAVMMVPDDALFWFSFDRIVAAADALRIPVAMFRSDFLWRGGLMSFGAHPEVLLRRTAYYVDRIVNGASPADLPVEQPRQLEFAVNLRKAAELGIDVPRHLVLRADTVLR